MLNPKIFCLMQKLLTWFVEGGPVFMSVLTVLLVAIFFAAWKAPRWVKEIGALALLLGFLGMIMGQQQVLSYLQRVAIEKGEGVSGLFDLTAPRILLGGLKITLIPLIYGAIIDMVAIVVSIIQKPRL